MTLLQYWLWHIWWGNQHVILYIVLQYVLIQSKKLSMLIKKSVTTPNWLKVGWVKAFGSECYIYFCFCSSLIKLNSLFTVQGTTRGADVCGFISTRGKLNFHIYARQASAYLKVWLWKLSCRLRPWALRLKKCLNQELYEHTGDRIAQEVQVLQEAILYEKTESAVQASLKGLRVIC